MERARRRFFNRCRSAIRLPTRSFRLTRFRAINNRRMFRFSRFSKRSRMFSRRRFREISTDLNLRFDIWSSRPDACVSEIETNEKDGLQTLKSFKYELVIWKSRFKLPPIFPVKRTGCLTGILSLSKSAIYGLDAILSNSQRDKLSD